MTAFTNPLLGVLVGAAFTGIIQSSAASVGILQALAMTGSVTYGMAIPIIMGQNIGTCVTALISSIGVSRNAKRVSVIHISFNLIGTAVWPACVLCGGNAIFGFPFLYGSASTPWASPSATRSSTCAPPSCCCPSPASWNGWPRRLVLRLRTSPPTLPSWIPACCGRPAWPSASAPAMADQMGAPGPGQTLNLVLDQFLQYTEAREEEILANEDKLDIYEDRLGGYLVQISQHGTSADDNAHQSPACSTPSATLSASATMS